MFEGLLAVPQTAPGPALPELRPVLYAYVSIDFLKTGHGTAVETFACVRGILRRGAAKTAAIPPATGAPLTDALGPPTSADSSGQ